MTDYYDVRLTITVPLKDEDDDAELSAAINAVVKTEWMLHDDGVDLAYTEDEAGNLTEPELNWG